MGVSKEFIDRARAVGRSKDEAQRLTLYPS